MKLIDIKQQTLEWHAWRAGGLGGSDIAAIMGVSPWVTREQLMEQKLGLRKPDENFAMRRGTRLEPEALRLVCHGMGKDFVPQCVQHDDCEWMRVSLDGLFTTNEFTGDECVFEILEIKCPNWAAHEMALEGFLPKYYVPQVQYQLLVTGAYRCIYASYNDGKKFPMADHLKLIDVLPDAELQAHILEAAEAFWAELQELRAIQAGQSLANRMERCWS
jgi:putative phage-type endonuclease